MPAPAIKIRIGAQVDQAQIDRSFATVEKRAGKTEQALQRSSRASAREQTRAAQQGARAQEVAQERVSRSGRKAADDWARSLRQIGRVAEQELNRQARAFQRAERRAGHEFANRTSHRATRFLTPNAPIGSMASRMGRDIARGVGVDFNFGNSLSRLKDLETNSVNLSNAGYLRGRAGPAGQRQDPRAIVQEAKRVGNVTGMDPGSAIAGLQAFVTKTGDLETGRAVLEDMARLAKATSSNLEDVVAAAGDVAGNFGDVAGSAEEAQQRAQQIRDVMRVIAGGGKLGAVDMPALATQMAKLSSSATAFTGDKSANLASMNAVAQMARSTGGAASPTQAATSVAAMVNTLRTPARMAKFKANGVNLEAGNGKFNDIKEIIVSSIKAAGTNTGKFKSMWANVQGARAVEGFRQEYLEAGGGDKGEAAVRALFAKYGSGAMITGEEESESLAKALDTTSSKAQIFQNRLDEIAEKVAGKLLPALETAGPSLLKFADVLGQASTWVIENPKAAIAGAITASIMRAGIESALRSGIDRLIVGPGGSRAAAAGKVMGNIGAAGTIGALAVTTLTVGMMVIDSMLDKARERQRQRVHSDLEAANASASAVGKARAGDLPGAAKDLEQSIATKEANIAEQKANMNSWQRRAGDYLADQSGKDGREALASRDAAEKRSLEQQQRELAASRDLLQSIQNTLASDLRVRITNMPEGDDGRESQ